MKSLHDAGRELFGESFTVDGIEFAGRLDPLIISDMLVFNGKPDSPANHADLRAAYTRHLGARLATPGVARALPGTLALLDALRDDGRPTIGLLTGNFETTGKMKLRASGIEPARFHVSVWGDESPHRPPRRDHLPPVAMRRYQGLRGSPIDTAQVTIIGDTPHDVACARAHGCRSLGVATGRSSGGELRAAGADRVEEDLSDTRSVLAWLLGA